ncbi:type III-B CRISPR-associated protein Cas10/Cmr2 [Niveispirillum irakense]|uniref:type III-B CRISPR-associated protein Cas10/Cmr2 n=1 Tax=Niveispirillum irakense TaxID=34011 RepID=UPI0003F8DB6F|nr:type III-B CRISPR-associated protein Cas10/Cmr2 [Niveispirillum irakense]
MTDATILHVKIGPVQTFIRQARRTRDLWAGSFLLSWLSGKAMVVAAAGDEEKIESPSLAGDAMWAALTDKTADGSLAAGPTVATLPNHFSVDVQGRDGGQVGNDVSDTVAKAWKALADAVWKTFLEGVGSGENTRVIWDRQINHFWQVSWSVGDGAVFAGRGSWRFPKAGRADEGGDHCSIMGDYQELSGYVRAKGGGKEQDAFWDDVRASISHVIYKKDQANGSLELGRSERLCAIALVKRLFPLLPLKTLQDIIGWIPVEGERINEGTARKWLRKYPSTAHMAARPWLLKSKEHLPGGKAALDDYLHFVKEMAKGPISARSEFPIPDLDLQEEYNKADGQEIVRLLIKSESDNRQRNLRPQDIDEFLDLDGTLFFEDGIARRRAEIQANRDRDPAGSRPIPEQEREAVKALQEELAKLQKATAPDGGRRQRKMVKASPFYALLRMDGDNIGKELQAGRGKQVSAALTLFTADAGDILSQHYGLPIYVGGDDVLALLPLHRALLAAEELRRVFVKHMRSQDCQEPTLSAGMVFAHYTTPLGTVLDLSKELLEVEAKANHGRNSLALALLKSSGEAARFVTKWCRDCNPVVPMLTDLTVAFAQDDERSSSLIHNLQSRLADLFRDGTDGRLGGDDLISLLLAERMRGKDKADRERARAEMEQLAALCRTKDGAFRLDAALIAKFLADNGGWYGLPGMKP